MAAAVLKSKGSNLRKSLTATANVPWDVDYFSLQRKHDEASETFDEN